MAERRLEEAAEKVGAGGGGNADGRVQEPHRLRLVRPSIPLSKHKFFAQETLTIRTCSFPQETLIHILLVIIHSFWHNWHIKDRFLCV